MRKFGVIFGLIALVLVTSIGITLWSAMSDKTVAKEKLTQHELINLKKAQQLMTEGKTDEAMTIISQHKNEIKTLSPNGVKWLDLYIRALELEHNDAELVAIYEDNKDALAKHEDASIILANSFILSNQGDKYASLRSLWKNRELDESAWFLLDADYLLLQGRRKEAAGFLQLHTIEGNEDIGRLLRLALLRADENPKEAWSYLSEAYKISPSDPDIRSYRARHLENNGKLDQAHTEYRAAVALLPGNLYLKDQLADFYLRHEKYEPALDVLSANLSSNSIDVIWEKAYFWNRVIKPISFDWKQNTLPQGSLEPLIAYYVGLNDGQFWNQDAFAKIEHGEQFLTTQQSTYWMRLLQSLKDKDEKEALHLLTYNPFATSSWNPELELNLKSILSEEHKSIEDAFAAALFTAKWPEAAIGLDSTLSYNTSLQAVKIFMEMKEYSKAKQVIMNQPELLTSTVGRETLGRIALQEDDAKTADEIYLSLENSSAEARSYLAKKAYNERNWEKARELTELLIKDYPDNKVLNDNLKKIVEEQAKTSSFQHSAGDELND